MKLSPKNLLGLAAAAGWLGLAELGVRGLDGFAEERAATRRRERPASPEGGARIPVPAASVPRLRGQCYKQPQQLIALILLSLQGVRFDAVVNLDGFNEVALSSTDAGMRYNPLLASRRHYLLMMSLGRDAGAIERYAEVIGTRRRIGEWRAAADHWLAGRSELLRAAFGRVVLELETRAARLEQHLQEQASPPPGLAAWEPECLQRSEKCWDLIADIWQSSSLQMAAISQQLGARYLHVLQPNQYDEGSKPLSEHEREIAYAPDGEWPAGARRGYPLLRARIPELRARGVAVLDLSQLFAGVSEDIYSDPCCHYNLRGNDLLATAIARAILQQNTPTQAATP